MWAELVKYLPTFRSAVLSGTDAAGYPLSVRCTPRLDHAARVLRVAVPPGVELRPGPAGLLCHSHDERLWNLRSFNVRGVLERDGEGWVLRPVTFISGGGIGGPLAALRALRDMRRTAARYLARRGLATPAIPWEQINAAKAEATGKRR
jgi:hypothetical protein